MVTHKYISEGTGTGITPQSLLHQSPATSWLGGIIPALCQWRDEIARTKITGSPIRQEIKLSSEDLASLVFLKSGFKN